MRRALALVALIASPAAAEPSVADLSFLIGNWVQEEENGRVTRETWVEGPGLISGINVTSRPGRPPVNEYMRISNAGGRPAFVAQPGGAPPTTFPLKSNDEGRWVFENPGHDFPQRVIYWRCDADLCARIEGVMNGAEASRDWRFKRAE